MTAETTTGTGATEDRNFSEALADAYRERALGSQKKGFWYVLLVLGLLLATIYGYRYSRDFAIVDVQKSDKALKEESMLISRPAELHDIASCGGTTIAVGRRGLIRTSKDDGATWKDSSSGTWDDLDAVAFSGDCEVVIAVGEEGAALVSTDDGGTWDAPETNTRNDFNEVALSDDGRAAIAVGDKGLFRFSTDGGKTWSPPDNNVTGKDVNDVALSGDGRMAVAVGDDNVIRISRDGGMNWVDSGVGIWPRSGGRERDDFRAVALRVEAGKPAIAAAVIGQRGALLFSADVTAGEVEWTRKTGKEDRSSFEDVAFSGENAVAVGRRGAIWTSADGGETWNSRDGRQGNHLYAVALTGDGNVAVAVGRDGTILVSTKDMKVWKSRNVRTKDELEAVAFGFKEKVLMIVGEGEAILRSEYVGREIFQEIEMVRLEGDTRLLPQPDVASGEGMPDNESSRLLSEELRALSQGNLLRGVITVLFMFMAQHLFGLARYEFRLAAFYHARRVAILLVPKNALPRPRNVDEFNQLMQALSPDDLETGRPSKTTMDRMMRMMDRFIPEGRRRGGDCACKAGKCTCKPGADTPG